MFLISLQYDPLGPKTVRPIVQHHLAKRFMNISSSGVVTSKILRCVSPLRPSMPCPRIQPLSRYVAGVTEMVS